MGTCIFWKVHFLCVTLSLACYGQGVYMSHGTLFKNLDGDTVLNEGRV